MKKIASNLAGFVLIITIFILSFSINVKNCFKQENIEKLITKEYNQTDKYSEDYFIELINGSNTNDIYRRYFNNDEIKQLYIKYYSEYILYANGVPDLEQPEFNDLKNKIDTYLENYETETGFEADRTASFNYFYNLDEIMANKAFISKGVKQAVSLSYNKNIRDIIVAISLVCIIIIIILNRDYKKILLHISSIFISEGVGILVVNAFIKKTENAITNNAIQLKILENLSSKFNKVCIICFIFGIIALIGFVLIKIFFKRNSKPEIREVTTTAIPTMNNTGNSNFFNTDLNNMNNINNMSNMNNINYR